MITTIRYEGGNVAVRKLSERTSSTIANALRVAAAQYRTDHDLAVSAQQPRLAEQFARQAADADALIDQFEEHDVVLLGDWKD